MKRSEARAIVPVFVYLMLGFCFPCMSADVSAGQANIVVSKVDDLAKEETPRPKIADHEEKFFIVSGANRLAMILPLDPFTLEKEKGLVPVASGTYRIFCSDHLKEDISKRSSRYDAARGCKIIDKYYVSQLLTVSGAAGEVYAFTFKDEEYDVKRDCLPYTRFVSKVSGGKGDAELSFNGMISLVTGRTGIRVDGHELRMGLVPGICSESVKPGWYGITYKDRYYAVVKVAAGMRYEFTFDEKSKALAVSETKIL